MGLFGKKAPAAPPLHGARIEDYAIIGDCETAALVSRECSIDWLCWPSFQSGACFAALLGTKEHGYWKIFPTEKVRNVSRRYEADTLVLETTLTTDRGEVVMTDFMPPRGKHSDVIRIIRGVSGRVAMRMDLVIRFDYGLTIPWVTMHERNLRAVAGPNMAVVRADCLKGTAAVLRGEDMKTVSEFTIDAGDEICFTMTYAASNQDVPSAVPVKAALEDTRKYWLEWSSRSTYNGTWKAQVNRSLLTLKAMNYRPTGGVVAAVTMGLPEKIGGERNWDYRYCWLRDTAFTLLVLMRAGYSEEAIWWRLWLLRAVAGAPDQVQTLYGICGERKLLEWEVGWLPGYENSRPVRCGNAAAEQFQLDIFGEVAAALSRVPNVEEEDLRVPAAQLEQSLIEHLCHIWTEPDEGIWETRGGRRHFVHSKVMAWLALDRAVKNHERFDGKGDVKRWRKNRDMLHKEICAKGFNKKLNSFVQSYGSTALDASLLRIVMLGFLPADDPRIIGTVDAIQKNLMKDGLVCRYLVEKSPDGLSGGEGSFLACSFWLVIALHVIGRKEEARTMFEDLLKLCNDVGLLSEEYDPVAKRMLGNFPQALSHIALAHAAFALDGLWTPEPYSK